MMNVIQPQVFRIKIVVPVPYVIIQWDRIHVSVMLDIPEQRLNAQVKLRELPSPLHVQLHLNFI